VIQFTLTQPSKTTGYVFRVFVEINSRLSNGRKTTGKSARLNVRGWSLQNGSIGLHWQTVFTIRQEDLMHYQKVIGFII